MPNRSKSKKTKHLSLILRTAVAVTAIFWVFRGQNWGQLAKTFSRLNLWYFALSLGVFIIAQVFIGFRWWLLLRAQSIFIGFWTAVRLNFLGLFYNNFMPGSVGGDLLRAWYVTKHTDKKLEAALSVFVDRALGLLCMMIIAVVCYLLFMRGRSGLVTSSDKHGFLKSVAQYRWILLSLFVGVAALVCLLLLHRSGRTLLRKAWSFAYVHGTSVIKRLREAIVIYCTRFPTILAALALTIFLQTLVVTAFWLLGLNLGIEANARYYFVFFPITWVLGALPVSIAGIGIHEGGLVELFTRFAGVAPETVLALALCQRAIFMLASLPGAAIHLIGAHLPGDPKRIKMRLRNPKDFFIDSDKPIA